MKLKISAPATVLDENDGNRPICDHTRLSTLNGIASDECFSDYLADDPLTKELVSRGVSGGYLRFQFRSDRNKIWAETEYTLWERLTDTEVESLRNYTIAQWTDGIDENFSPEYAEQTGIFLSPETDQAIVEIIES